MLKVNADVSNAQPEAGPPVTLEGHLGPSDEETAEVNEADARIAEAARILEAEDEPKGDADEPQDEPEAAEAAPDKDEPAEPAEAEPEPAEKGPSAADLLQQQIAVRRQAKQTRDAQRRVEEQLAELKAQQESVAQREQAITELFRTDPEAALSKAAELAGTTTDGFYERLTRQRLNQGEPDAAAAFQETKRLHAELAKLREEMTTAEQKRTEQAQQAQAQAAYQADVAELCSVQSPAVTDSPEAVERWGHVMAWPPDRLELEARAAASWAHKQSGPVDHASLMDDLERIAKAEYEHMHKTISGRSSAAEDQDTSEPEQEPEPSKSERGQAAPPKPARTVTTKNAATGGTRHREPEPGTAEFYEKAGELLGDFDL